MKRTFFIMMLSVLLSLALTGCGSKKQPVTFEEFAPGIYEEQPKTIVILPPMNATTAADAPIYYSTTIYSPLVLRGYYVFPYDVTTRILMDNGFISTEELLNNSLEPFNEYFGADAILFSTIHKWDLAYAVLAATLSVDIECTLRSTKTGKDLWNIRKNIVIDLTGRSSSGNPLVDLIAQAVATSIAAAAADYVPYAYQLTHAIALTLPSGPYLPDYGQDRNNPSGIMKDAE